MSIFQKVTLKTLKENKTRTIVTIIGIILSLSMFTAVTTSVSSFQSYMLKVTKFQEGNWHGAVGATSADRETLTAEERIEAVSFLENIGYARLTGCTNPDKPYLFIGGLDEHAPELLPILITDGRMPENGDEILLPSHLSYNGGVYYNLGDTLNLKIGKRISTDEEGKPFSLGQNISYLYTEEEQKAAALAEGRQLDENELRNLETETFVPDSAHTYTVVGFYERPAIEPFSAPGYTALTLSGTPAADGSGAVDSSGAAGNSGTVDNSDTMEYTAYLRFENPKNAIPWLDSHYSENYRANYDLLRMYGASFEAAYNSILYGLASVLIAIILFGSVSLIYNAFSISVTERTRQFGLLASLGATRKQLVRSVLFEAFCLCIIGIPLGILAGIAGIGITFSLLGASLSELLLGGDLWNIPLTLQISPDALAIAVLIGLFTVLLSAYLPARRGAKLSPMDAIRQTSDITIRPGKVKTSKLTYRLFGLSGMLASKSFKRNRKKYRATVVSLFVSVVLFISASSFCSYLRKSAGDMLSDSGYDINYSCYTDEGTISKDQLLTELCAVENVTDGALVYDYWSQIYLDKASLSPEYIDYLKTEPSYMSKSSKDLLSSSQFHSEGMILFIDDESYEDYLREAGLPAKIFMNPKRPIGTAVDFSHINFLDENTGKYTTATFSMLKPQNTTVSLMQENPQGGYKKRSASIGHIQTTAPYFVGGYYGFGLLLMYPVSAMEAVIGPGETAKLLEESSIEYYFMASDHKKATKNISEKLKNFGLNTGASMVFDRAEDIAQQRTLLLIINVFSYGFITLISLIAAANVFNTISTNIQLRKREFAMLKSTGMEPRGFTVMMCYECLLYGIKGLLYGLPVSIFVTYWIYQSVSGGLETSFYIPWPSLVIAIGSVFLVVGSTMIYSMGKIRKENIIDNLKNDTI